MLDRRNVETDPGSGSLTLAEKTDERFVHRPPSRPRSLSRARDLAGTLCMTRRPVRKMEVLRSGSAPLSRALQRCRHDGPDVGSRNDGACDAAGVDPPGEQTTATRLQLVAALSTRARPVLDPMPATCLAAPQRCCQFASWQQGVALCWVQTECPMAIHHVAQADSPESTQQGPFEAKFACDRDGGLALQDREPLPRPVKTRVQSQRRDITCRAKSSASLHFAASPVANASSCSRSCSSTHTRSTISSAVPTRHVSQISCSSISSTSSGCGLVQWNSCVR